MVSLGGILLQHIVPFGLARNTVQNFYGKDPHHLVHYGHQVTPVSQVEEYLEKRDNQLKELKEHLIKSQELMKRQANTHR